MPLNQQQLKDYVQTHPPAQPKPGSFGTPPIAEPKTPDEQISDMPNSSKLTKLEKGIYKTLPGVTTWMDKSKIMGLSVSEQLEKFNASFVGKALNKLDFLAEGLERTSGLVAQALQGDLDSKELKAAWFAGSLTYDVANAPQFMYDDEGKNIIGLKIDTDMPGVDGLTESRAKIQAYMNAGMSPQEALARTRDEVYSGLGALALRAQLHDLTGHVLADPLNLITGYLKPLEALKARRFTALTTKITATAEDIVTKADEVAKLARLGENAADSLKLMEEAAIHAQNAGDLARATQYTQEAADIAKATGKLAKYEELAQTTERLAKTASNAEEATHYSTRALEALGKKQITSYDKFAIMMTGGDPFRPSKLGQAFEKVPIVGRIAKAFQLTPESKAKELMNLLSNNYSIMASRMMDSPTFEADFAGLLRRIEKGATGAEYGHALLTLEGKTAQGFAAGSSAVVSKILQDYDLIAPQRTLLNGLAQSLGESPAKILKMANDDPAALLKLLASKAGTDPAIAMAMQTGELTEDGLRSLTKIVADNPYNKEMFLATALDAIETQAMRQAVLQFGVKSKGALTRWSEAMKAAESLAFLKLNPGYPIRNKINNDVTMLARGLFGFDTEATIGKYWDDFGMTPERLGDLGLSSELGKGADKLSEAEKILKNALDGGEWGLADKAKEFFQKMDIGRLDATKWGNFEVKASRKAMTLGTRQFLHEYYNPTKLKEYIAPKVMDELGNVAPEFARNFDNAIRSAAGSQKKLDEILGANLNLNVDNLLDDVAERLGVDVRQQLGSEALQHLHDNLPTAIKNGTLDQFNLEMKGLAEKHVEDLFQKQIDNVVEHVKAQAAVGGPNVWNKQLSEASDIFWNAHIEHSIGRPEATRLAVEASAAGDYSLARTLWEKEAADSRMFYNRAFRRVDAYIEGLEQGTAHLAKQGVKLPFKQVKNTFREWKGTWEKFFTERNRLNDDFFKAVDAGNHGNYADVQAQISKMYESNIKIEDDLMQRIDDQIASMIDEPEIKKTFMAARDQLAQMKQQDRLSVLDLYKRIQEAKSADRQKIFAEFFQQRQIKQRQMKQMDQITMAIQEGDPRAMDLFAQAQAAATPEAGKFDINTLANEYGIPSATPGGARNDKRILATVNKYLKDNPDLSTKTAKGTKGKNALTLIQESGGINKAEFPDVTGGKLGVDKQGNLTGLFQTEGMGIDEAGRLLVEHGFMTQDEAADANKIRDFIRNYKNTELPSDEAIDLAQAAHYAEGGFYKDIKDIPEDVARQAFEARAAEKGTQVPTPTKAPQVNPNFSAEYKKIVPDPEPIDLSLDYMNYGRINPLLDEVVNSAKAATQKTPMMLKDLPENLQAEVRKALELAKNDMAAARHTAVKFGEFRRDSALLNYNRRTNFDNMLAHVAPFSFWTTGSMAAWAVNSIDRPAMLTNYLRYKQFMATAGLQRDGQATRTKGKFRISLPFAPDWMGEQFIDPMRVALPFDGWMSPFEQMQKDQQGMNGQVTRLLDQQLADGQITQEDYDEAVETQSGNTWDFAASKTAENNSQDRYDAFDFATALASPHAPLMWAYNAAFGDKQNIGPFAPASRHFRNAATLLGVDDWNNSKWNVEAKIRKQMGLPAFDKWDNYRIKRAASDLAGEGKLTPDDAKEAIALEALIEQGKMTPEQAKQQSEAYRMAVTRSNQEFTGGPGAAILGLFGMSVTSVPKGENNLRSLQDDFGRAYNDFKSGNDALEKYIDAHPELDRNDATDQWEAKYPKLAKKQDALGDFFEAHPEYETRLGLFDEPEVQVHKFMMDQLWKKYNEMPTLNQQEIRDHLGADFQDAFLSSTTRDYDSITPEKAAVWLKIMGADPLGGLTADQDLLVSLYGKVKFSNPELAQRVETFYNARKQNFPNYNDKQSAYFNLPKDKRKAYLAKNPDLKQYWDWRSQFFNNNPDMVPYISDNEKAIEKAKNQTRSTLSVPTANEIRANFSPPLQRILAYSQQTGEALPFEAEQTLEQLAEEYGISVEELMNIFYAGNPQNQ